MRREVRVLPHVASLYPTLDPDQWYTAAAVAGLVKGTRILHEGTDTRFVDRILDPDHFDFRCGGPRRGSWAGMYTRRLDRHPALAAIG
jgi:hypothetical protein